MPRHIRLQPHLAVDELERRYRAAKEPHERSWYQILWLLAKGQTARAIAVSTGYSPYWIGQIAKRYNAEGPAGMTNRQYTHSHRAVPLLSDEQLAELAEAVRGPAPQGDSWLGRMVAAWMSAKSGRPVSVQLSWAYLVRLDGKRRKPRPRHVLADPAQQEAFKKTYGRCCAPWPRRLRAARSNSGPRTSIGSA
jgi:transposase